MPETMRSAPVGGRFAELVCADPEWLDAEFEAIMAANLLCRPPLRHRVDFSRPPRPPWLRVVGAAAQHHGAAAPVRFRWRRERSPPRRGRCRDQHRKEVDEGR